MKFVYFLGAAILLSLGQSNIQAEDTNRVAQTNSFNGINREQLIEELKKMTPQERQAKIRELNEQFRTNRVERPQLQTLTPEEREAKMKEWRERRQAATNRIASTNSILSSQTNDTAARSVEQLRKKKANGTITPQEEQFLKRIDERMKAAQEKRARATTNPPPTKPDEPK